jgi:2-dehydro-3-deoxyphosphogluconate aldolase/(4S)-4-hydroxy-2-oxoglutarate aldolase
MELAFRTPAALESLYKIKENVPELIAGVGTILTSKQVQQAAEAKADFAVAPGLNPHVVTEAAKANLPFAPGVATPSDIEAALSLDCKVLKFFPAEAIGGLKYLKSMAAPYAHLKLTYIPLGGININNLAGYLADPLISAVGGSWIANQKLIFEKDWKTITANAKEASQIAKQIIEETA